MSELPFRFHKTLSVLISLGYLLFFFWAASATPDFANWLREEHSLSQAWWGVVCALGWLILALATAGALRTLPGKPRRALDVLAFVLLPAWGLILNADVTGECTVLFAQLEYRPLACPEVYGLLVLHAATAGGYAISRRRSELLPARVEPWVVASLLCGLLLNIALAVQLATLFCWLLLFPLMLPLIAPFVLVVLFWKELRRRLRSNAQRAQAPALLGPALLRAPVVLGAHGLLQGLWLGHARAALDVFTRTCTHPLSTLPLHIKDTTGGHYLCTIAAQGHPALVRPERLGIRRGRPIIVNRQLATANAFEDLLHVRWPRFGRAARACYDRLAIPICHRIKSRWQANLLYLAMKPAEWLFYLVLLVFDREPPEARIDRMYR